jgi:hypothetical protein
MNAIRGVAALSAALVLSGCYHYVPTTASVARQGAPVRAHLASISDFELAQITVNNIDQVDGEMIRVDAGQLFLSATWLEAITGNGYAGNGWTVQIPEANMTGLEQKRVSVWRTGVVIAGLITGTWLGFDALGLTPGSGGEGGGTPTPQ